MTDRAMRLCRSILLPTSSVGWGGLSKENCPCGMSSCAGDRRCVVEPAPLMTDSDSSSLCSTAPSTPVAVRAAILLPLALVLTPLLMGNLPGADDHAQAALFTLLAAAVHYSSLHETRSGRRTTICEQRSESLHIGNDRRVHHLRLAESALVEALVFVEVQPEGDPSSAAIPNRSAGTDFRHSSSDAESHPARMAIVMADRTRERTTRPMRARSLEWLAGDGSASTAARERGTGEMGPIGRHRRVETP
jgi:hypothetical protein